MNEHTPGPWYVSGSDIHARWTDSDGNVTDRWIATVSAGKGDVPRMTDYANARLIAAAPEMLELLHKLARGANLPFDHPDARAMHKAGSDACALLARIEGRET